MVSRALRYVDGVNLALAGMVAGAFVIYVWSLSPVLMDLPAARYIEDQQKYLESFKRQMFLGMLGVGVSSLAVGLLAWAADARGAAWAFLAAAFVVATVVVTV